MRIIENIIEESVSDKRAISSYTKRLVQHMLKCKYQNDYSNKRSWRNSISDSLSNLLFMMMASKTLKKFYLKEMDFDLIYRRARKDAERETGLGEFPKTCEWSKSQLIDEEFIDDFIDTYGKDYE